MVWFPKPFITYVVPVIPGTYEADAVIETNEMPWQKND